MQLPAVQQKVARTCCSSLLNIAFASAGRRVGLEGNRQGGKRTHSRGHPKRELQHQTLVEIHTWYEKRKAQQPALPRSIDCLF